MIQDITREEALRQIPEIPVKNKLRCYNTAGHKHGDNVPSIHLYDNGFFCFSCGQHGTYSWLVKMFGGASLTPRREIMEEPKEHKKYDLIPIWKNLPKLPEEVLDMLLMKGLSQDDIENAVGWRWHMNEIEGWKPGIFMPYVAGKQMVGARLRCIEGTPRFMSLPGGESWPYCFNKLRHQLVMVTEGETDCLTLNFNDIPAVGIPGATNTNAINKMVAEAKRTGARLVVVPDNDEAGAKFKERIFVACFKAMVDCYEFNVPAPHKDLNDWFVAVGKQELQQVVVDWMMTGFDDFAEKVQANIK